MVRNIDFVTYFSQFALVTMESAVQVLQDPAMPACTCAASLHAHKR